jgi:hypothetical protein
MKIITRPFLEFFFCGGQRVIYLAVSEGLWSECNQRFTYYTLQNVRTENDANHYKYNIL